MSIVPLDVQRRCERRWAARFPRPTELVATRNPRSARDRQQITEPQPALPLPGGVKAERLAREAVGMKAKSKT